MNKTRKKVNITLPPETLELIDRVSKDNRSEFINRVVKLYVNRLERAKEDLAIAQEWEPIEQELWEKFERAERS